MVGKLGVIGIMFDVDDYSEGISDATVAAIDKFFDSLQLYRLVDEASFVATSISLGELMA